MMDSRYVYRGYAAECFTQAETTKNTHKKALYVQMAISWLKLAERADEVAKLLDQPASE